MPRPVWPADSSEDPIYWRVAVFALTLAYYLTCDRWEFARRHFVLWGTALGSIMAATIGGALGSLGAIDEPSFGSLYFVPIMSIPFFMRPSERLAGTTTVALAAFAGFFAAAPQTLSHPGVGTAVGLMAFGIAVSVLAGHALYHFWRLGHLGFEQLAVRTRELEALSSSLASRMDARTAELRLLAAHVEHLREAERGALARDLHDELGQLLTGIRMELDVTEAVRARGGDIRPQQEKLEELLDATLASTRSILAHLRPRVLDDFGLVAALEWLTTDTARRSGLDVHFEARPDEFEVPGEVATGVFRIVQESLTNVLRHANARRVEVEIELATADSGVWGSPPTVLLVATVTDDGVGLPPEEQRRPVSLGLLGMRERATALGGTFGIAARAQGGTVVTVTIPRAAAPEQTKEVVP